MHAEDEPALLGLIQRALDDREFHRALATAAAATTGTISDVATGAAEIDAAILALMRRERDEDPDSRDTAAK